MLKYLIVITLLKWTTAATIDLSGGDHFVPILIQGEEKNSDGSFAYYFEGADGGQREEVGRIKNPGTKEQTLVVTGSYSYINANGEQVIVQYTADENGFRPKGTIIPKEITRAAAALRSSMQSKQEVKIK